MMDILADRITLMMIFNKIPLELFNCRLTMLSKTKSSTVESVKDIRPIGILSFLWKVIERAMKNIIEKIKPNFFETYEAQAGFTRGKSTLDHLVLMLQR